MRHLKKPPAFARLSLAIVLANLGGSSFASHAADRDRGPSPGSPPAPPPAAIQACKGKTADDACEMTFQDRKISGKCVTIDEGVLVCRPERPPGPPREVFAACEGKVEGDTCSVRFGEVDRQGKCSKGRSGRLICLPH